MPLGRTPTERYAMRLRSACKLLTKEDPSLATVGSLNRTKENDGYDFFIRAKGELWEYPLAIVRVNDDGYVFVEVIDDDFPEHLLECVVHRAEILR